MFDLFLYETPLRALRLGESLFFFSRQGAEYAGEKQEYIFALSAPLREHNLYLVIHELKQV